MGLLTRMIGGPLADKAIGWAKGKGKKDEGTGGVGSGESFAQGGPVRKTGLAKVHKGEHVLTKAQAKAYRKRGRKHCSKG